MSETIIIAIIGIVASAISSFITWLVTRRKYNSEVEGSDIKNLQETLEFYKKITVENKNALEYYIKIVEDERVRNYIITTMTLKLLDKSCTKENCLERQFYTDAEIDEIFDIINKRHAIKGEPQETNPNK